MRGRWGWLLAAAAALVAVAAGCRCWLLLLGRRCAAAAATPRLWLLTPPVPPLAPAPCRSNLMNTQLNGQLPLDQGLWAELGSLQVRPPACGGKTGRAAQREAGSGHLQANQHSANLKQSSARPALRRT